MLACHWLARLCTSRAMAPWRRGIFFATKKNKWEKE